MWLDDESRKFATEMQRSRHVRYQQQRWLPGWIDSIEHFDYGGAIITITLFGGMDQSLYDDMKASRKPATGSPRPRRRCGRGSIAPTAKSAACRTGRRSRTRRWAAAAFSCSLKFTEVLEGYRPGRSVRLKCDRWAFVTMPFEERVKSLDEQKRSAVMSLP